ncbi:hypothetical protein OG21DRAFT_1115120 [Imleria badia]|nr:hypothetical protein OG21DRAFT_1115120 [Imleria badia]
MLAAEALVALYNTNDEEHLNVGLRNPNFRANIAGTLVRLNPNNNRTTTTTNSNARSGYEILRHLFGLDAESLSEPQKNLIGELKTAIETGKPRERTAATMTLLKLCETPIIRAYLREINVLNVFIDLLQVRGSALLAAYALATCLKHDDMKASVKDNEDLPKYIVGMLRLDHFDDAVGQVEGFQIFGDIMQHADLRGKIKDYNITEVLNAKLGRGKPKEIRTSLICLDIFRSFDPDGPWTRELVTKSLDHLRNPEWKFQKAGVTILSALAQTGHGADAIKERLPEIVEMLLPAGYLLIASISAGVPSSASPGGAQATERETVQLARGQSTSPESPSKPPSSVFGPACALRILAQNSECSVVPFGEKLT